MATGYRAFPPLLFHPSRARRFDVAEFDSVQKTKMQAAAPCVAGHAGTNIWYSASIGYIVEVLFLTHSPIHIHSPCTFTPTHGMDTIDGEFAQDAEEQALHEALGIPTKRLSVYSANGEVTSESYLRQRGYIK